MSQNMHTLLAIAADLRSGGASWDAVASQVGRQTSTCQQWPSRFRDTWLPLYHAAQQRRLDEAGAEALHMLRHHMRSLDTKTSLRSIELLLRYGQRAAPHLPQTPPPSPAEAKPSGEDVLSPEDRDWLAIGRYFGEERQRSDAERAAQGLPPTTDDEFYGAYLREFQSINTPPTEPNTAAPDPSVPSAAAPARADVHGFVTMGMLLLACALTVPFARPVVSPAPTAMSMVAALDSSASGLRDSWPSPYVGFHKTCTRDVTSNNLPGPRPSAAEATSLWCQEVACATEAPHREPPGLSRWCAGGVSKPSPEVESLPPG